MPKLNVQQNNQNVIQAFKNALAIGRLKGIIASDGNHNFSTAGSNRNLLDNPWFTVNQRSASGTVTPSAYVADRWQVFSGSATAGTYPTINASSNIGQRIAFDIEAGKTYTFSVLLADGTIVSGTKAVTDPNTTISFISNSLVELDYFGAQSPKNIRIYNTSGAALGVKAAKIELGSVSTLANDVPPEYGEELLKCLRYQWVVDAESVYGVVGDATVTTQNTEAMMVVHYPVPMYKVPTLSVSGAFRTVGGNGTAIVVGSVTSMTVTSNASNKNFARVTINGTTMGGTGTSVVVGANGAGAKLIFDANI